MNSLWQSYWVRTYWSRQGTMRLCTANSRRELKVPPEYHWDSERGTEGRSWRLKSLPCWTLEASNYSCGLAYILKSAFFRPPSPFYVLRILEINEKCQLLQLERSTPQVGPLNVTSVTLMAPGRLASASSQADSLLAFLQGWWDSFLRFPHLSIPAVAKDVITREHSESF